MRVAGKIVADALKLVQETIKPDRTTIELDRLVEAYVKERHGELAFKGYRGFPANICVSLNEELVHGIPGPRRMKSGDIVTIDVGVRYQNYYGDAAVTLTVGQVSPMAQRLVETARESLNRAIAKMQPGAKLSDVSAAIQDFVESQGFSVIRQYVGHGIGSELHEAPQVPNYRLEAQEQFEVILKPGIVLALEPMVTEGSYEVETLSNRWTVVTKDRKLSAHFEHTVAVTPEGCEVLTR